jgi:hypothetical protein
MMKAKRVRRAEGQVVKIPLGDGSWAYGRVLEEPLVALYDKRYLDADEPSIDEIVSLPVAFKIWVMNYAITKGGWPVIGKLPLSAELREVPAFFKQDVLNGNLSIYHALPEFAPHYERPATYEECLGLEEAAVWEPEHVEERLHDHFEGRKSKWCGSVMRPGEFLARREQLRQKRESLRNQS